MGGIKKKNDLRGFCAEYIRFLTVLVWRRASTPIMARASVVPTAGRTDAQVQKLPADMVPGASCVGTRGSLMNKLDRRRNLIALPVARDCGVRLGDASNVFTRVKPIEVRGQSVSHERLLKLLEAENRQLRADVVELMLQIQGLRSLNGSSE
jgi:hypothetical protein